MNKIYEDNIKNLLVNKTYLIDCLNENKETDYNVINSINGIAVEVNDYTYRLTSHYDQKGIVEKVLNKYEKATIYDIFILIGLSDGSCLESFFERFPNNTIIVYEPSTEIVKMWLSKGSKKEILLSDNIYIACGNNGKKWYEYFLDNKIKYNNIRHANFYILPGYQSIWTDITIWAYKSFCDHISNEAITKNTVMMFGRERNRKYFRNLHDLRIQYSSYDLCNSFRNNQSGECAIIVSAGPSLEKNIKILKQFKGKAFIIAVDSAIKALNSNSIEPDIVVTVDTEKRLDFLNTKFFENIPLVMETTGNAEIQSIHYGKRFYTATGEIYTREILNKFSKNIGYLHTGGSVANSAFSFAVECGYKNIILIGQDLAYPDNKLHVSDTYDNKDENKLDESNTYYEVEDIYGNMVLTERNMDIYRNWFERVISENDQLNVIDATEGGAKINGTKIETLEMVLKEDFISDSVFDYRRIIDSVNPLFSDDERCKFDEICGTLPQILEKNKKRLKDGILSYENLNRLKKRGLENSKEFKKEYNKVSKINQWLESYENIELLNMYQTEKDYEIQDHVLDVQENENDEWKEIIHLGIKYYNRYIDAIDDILEDIHFLINGR